MADAAPRSEPGSATIPIPRRGRLWVLAVLLLFLLALGYAIVDISTRQPGEEVVELAGVSDAQRIFGGLRQDGDRLGADEAPVAIQVFNDIQCGPCREDFLGTIPAIVETHVREGDVKLLYRHYAVGANPRELGFYGAEAAAEQDYGWQYVYLFFRNQDEAERLGIDAGYLGSIAAGIEELDEARWADDFEAHEDADSGITRRLETYDELGSGLGIRVRQAVIVAGPRGTRTLQDGPSLAAIERAIEAVGP